MAAAERRRPGSGAVRMAAGWALTVMIWVTACRDAPDSPGELEAIDVPPPLTVDIEQDPQAKPKAASLTGVLPGDFPSDLPLYLPASVVDFGQTGDGLRFVSLLTPEGSSQLRRGLERALRDKGWAPDGSSWRKSGRRVRLKVEDDGPGTVYRFEY